MFTQLRHDIQCILERDPAARNAWEVLTCYPGLHAVLLHRLAHGCWNMGLKWIGRFIALFSRWFTGIEIHPAAKVGRGVFFDHAMGVVVGETAEIGDGCTIYQGVTLGGTSLFKGEKRHPTLGRNVVVGAGAKVLGGFTVGDGARIGSNAVVLKAVPEGATAVGNPARVLEPQNQDASFAAYGVTAGDDPVSRAMHGLIDNAAAQTHQIALLWQAIQQLDQQGQTQTNCIPQDAATEEKFPCQKLGEWLDK